MKGLNSNDLTNNNADSTPRDERAALCGDLLILIEKRTDELTRLGFSPEMARFDCLNTMKIIVDNLYDEINVGHARQDWYREYVGLGLKKTVE